MLGISPSQSDFYSNAYNVQDFLSRRTYLLGYVLELNSMEKEKKMSPYTEKELLPCSVLLMLVGNVAKLNISLSFSA